MRHICFMTIPSFSSVPITIACFIPLNSFLVTLANVCFHLQYQSILFH